MLHLFLFFSILILVNIVVRCDLWVMVKTSNKRVMVTLPKTILNLLDEIAETYGMSKSDAVKMLIVVFHNSTKERMIK